MEQIDFGTPHVIDPRTATFFKVRYLSLDWDRQNILIRLSDGSIFKEFIYTGQKALDLMVALNKANLSTSSLQKRIINQLITDGHLSGTISGTPD